MYIHMLHRSTKLIACISIGVFVVSIAVCAIFFSFLSKQKVQFNELSSTQIEKQTHRTSLKVHQKALAESEEDRSSLKSRIVREENVIDFLSLTESLGKEQNVVLTTQSLTVEPINDVFESLVIQVEIEGLYQSVMHTVKLLERIPYQVMVYNLRMNRESDSGGMNWKGTLKLRVTKFKKI